jgi:hemerythrin superfamily protein
MSYPFSSFGPDDEPRLRDEHAFLERQLAEVIRLAEAGDRIGYESIWDLFTRELEHHMRYEENLLFPAFRRTGVTPDLWARQLRADHDELRRQYRSLGSASLQPTLLLEQLRQLARMLLDHKEREGLVLYPWLASLSPSRAAWGGELRSSRTTSSAEPTCAVDGVL